VRLAAGLLIALAVAARVSSWWLPAGILAAGLLCWCAPAPRPHALARGTALTARLAGLPLFAVAFAAYLVPGRPELAAATFLLVITVIDAVGGRVPGELRGWILGVLLVGAGILVVLCLAITPVRAPGGPAPGISGVLLAVAVMVPLLRETKPRWLPGSVVVALAVGGAALYQLGPVRLGLSVTSLRDVLGAADARALGPWLAAVVALATVTAALTTLREAKTGLGGNRWAGIACGLLVAVAASLLGPLPAVLLAATVSVAEPLVAGLLRLAERRTDPRALVTVVASVAVLAVVPPRYLLLGAAATALVTLGSRYRERRDRDPV
jgi:hypothetical protein